MTAITISRQLGSLGDEVAQAVAGRINFRIICRELINQAALRARVPEMALATIDDLGLLGIRPSPQARRAYHQAVQSVMEEEAERGDVIIIGRAGQVILHNYPNVLHVKVMAPAHLRAERISQQQNITLEAASARIDASDRTRRNYLRRFYNARWDDPDLYDLILNTERILPDPAACLICQAVLFCLQQTQHASYKTDYNKICQSE